MLNSNAMCVISLRYHDSLNRIQVHVIHSSFSNHQVGLLCGGREVQNLIKTKLNRKPF